MLVTRAAACNNNDVIPEIDAVGLAGLVKATRYMGGSAGWSSTIQYQCIVIIECVVGIGVVYTIHTAAAGYIVHQVIADDILCLRECIYFGKINAIECVGTVQCA